MCICSHQKKQTGTLIQTLLTLRTEAQTISKAVTSPKKEILLAGNIERISISKSCQHHDSDEIARGKNREWEEK